MGAQEEFELKLINTVGSTDKGLDGIQVGQLVGFNETYPLIIFDAMPGTAAIPARTVVDLRSDQIGSQIVIHLESRNPLLPIVLGVIKVPSAWPVSEKPAQVTVDADGERLIVDAKQEIVLRCGKASITLTKAGKVLIRGTYISSRSSGANRIKGGSVLLN